MVSLKKNNSDILQAAIDWACDIEWSNMDSDDIADEMSTWSWPRLIKFLDKYYSGGYDSFVENM